MRKIYIVLLALLATPLFALDRNIVDDVIKMSKAGVATDSIIEFVQKTSEPFEVTADDMIAMKDANVPKPVVDAVLDASKSRSRDWREGRPPTTTTRVVVEPRYYPYYAYDPFYYYDPFWYQPRLSLSFGFGGGYWGGHGRGGYHGGGGHHRR